MTETAPSTSKSPFNPIPKPTGYTNLDAPSSPSLIPIPDSTTTPKRPSHLSRSSTLIDFDSPRQSTDAGDPNLNPNHSTDQLNLSDSSVDEDGHHKIFLGELGAGYGPYGPFRGSVAGSP
ncbi:hypothetical protein T439DRAFT_341357, partial [Meredithblackwellia eburnea MCA 4105]